MCHPVPNDPNDQSGNSFTTLGTNNYQLLPATRTYMCYQKKFPLGQYFEISA